MTDRSRPLVTLGITTYNRAGGYLPLTLESAFAQTYPNLEILICDNASTDHTAELVESLDDPRIRYFRQEENIGVTPHFNFCLEQANGVYFQLLHDDDLIDPDFVETCMTAAGDREHYGLIRTGMRRIDDEGRVTRELPNPMGGLSAEEFFRTWFGGGTPMHLACTLFNTKLLKEVGGFESPRNLFCDVVPEARLAARYERVDVEDVKASFRIHGGKNSATGRIRDWCVDSQYLLQVVLTEMGGVDRSFRKAGMHFFTRHCLVRARSVAGLRNRWLAYYIVHRSFAHTGSFLLRKWITAPAYKFVRRGGRRVKALLGAGTGIAR